MPDRDKMFERLRYLIKETIDQEVEHCKKEAIASISNIPRNMRFTGTEVRELMIAALTKPNTVNNLAESMRQK